MKKFLRLLKSSSNVLVDNPIKTGLLCAISGGQDSVVSLFILFHHVFKLKKQKTKKNALDSFFQKNEILASSVIQNLDLMKFNKKIHFIPKNEIFGTSLDIVYCQHFWQVKNFFCSEFNFQLSYSVQIPYTVILSRTVLLNENRAREWRKNNFYRFLQLQKISRVLTGQTKSDDIETNLSNLFRGMSPNSLSTELQFYSRGTISIFFSCFISKPKKFSVLQIKKHSLKKPSSVFFLFKNRPINQKTSSLRFFQTQLNQEIHFSKGSYRKTKQFLLNDDKNKVTSGKNFQIIINNTGYYLIKNLLSLINQLSVNKKNFNFIEELQTSRLKEFYFFDSFLQLGLFEVPTKNFFLIYKNPKSYSFCFFNQNIKNQKKFFKPIQSLTRPCVSNFLNLYKFPVITDRTNFNTMFSRNRIRHQFLPINQLLFGFSFKSFFYKFLFLGQNNKPKLEFDFLELKMSLKCLRNQSYGNRIKTNLLFTLMPKNESCIFRLVLKMTILNYREIELTFQQIYYLEFFIGLPGTRTRN